MTHRRLGACILLAAIALQACLFFLGHRPEPRRLWGDEVMYLDLALREARGEPAQIDLLWPPLYPHFLCGLWMLGGGSRLPIELAQTLLLVLCAALVRDLACRFAKSRTAGDVAGALVLLDPQVAAFAHYLWPELLHMALFLSALWLLLLRRERPLWLLFAGTLLGLCLLTKSLLTPFVPLLLLPLFEAGARQGLTRSALVIVAMLASVAPVVWQNGNEQGSWAIADSARFNLLVGLLDRSPRNLVDEVVGDEYGRWKSSAPDAAGRDKILTARLEQVVSERGVVSLLKAQLGRQWFRLLDRDSFFTDQLPGGAIANLGFGYVRPPSVLSETLRVWSYGLYAVTLIAFWAGVAAAPEQTRWSRLFLAFLLYNAVLFLFLHVKTRYRLQMLPFCFLYVGLACVRPPIGAAPKRLAAAALGAAACLYLAFS